MLVGDWYNEQRDLKSTEPTLHRPTNHCLSIYNHISYSAQLSEQDRQIKSLSQIINTSVFSKHGSISSSWAVTLFHMVDDKKPCEMSDN